MKKSLSIWIYAIVFVLAVSSGLLYWLGSDNGRQKQEKLIKVRYATVPFLGEASSYVAYHNGYFEEEGLDIDLIKNPAGWMNLKALFEGRTDIANVADLPVAYSAMDKKKYTDFERGAFYIIADLIYSTKMQQVLARKDRGILMPKDIKGKRVALFRKTTSDFYLDAFLRENDLKASDIKTIDMDTIKQVDALVTGDVDVIFSWQPHIYNAQKQLGDNAVVLPTKLTYSTLWLSVVMKEYAEQHPEVLEKFLRALRKANRFIKENPGEAITIHANMSGVEREVIEAIWPDIDYTLSLSESLLMTLDDEARWIIRNKWTEQTKVPNFLNYIYFDHMETVNPDGITIIR